MKGEETIHTKTKDNSSTEAVAQCCNLNMSTTDTNLIFGRIQKHKTITLGGIYQREYRFEKSIWKFNNFIA